MARKKNDGRGRLGGRSKGTPNKTTTDLKKWLTGILDDNRSQFEEDLRCLLPVERLRILSGLFNYIIPKQQSLSIEEQIESETESLTRFLNDAPDEAIEAISQKILELQKRNQERSKSDKSETIKSV